MAVYFVGFDGQPEYGSMEIPVVETTEESFVTDLNVSPAENISSIDTQEPVFESYLGSTSTENSSIEPMHAESDLNHDFNLETLSEPDPSSEVEKPHPAKANFAAAAQEIADYGNQEEVISSISYDVAIKGLDTKEVMLAFKEAIEDSKFSWHTQDILSQIKNGEATLRNLNPIQAFVLASRIQFLDLDIDWKQNVAF
jgi:hypothetical protein